MKSLLYILILLLTACSLSAQQTIKGIVTDAENGQPVDAATVQIRKAGRQVPLTYTLTKAEAHSSSRSARQTIRCSSTSRC